MKKHDCHNRPPFPHETQAQDGWDSHSVHDDAGTLQSIVTPVIVAIPWAFKRREHCVQWEPLGAVACGIMSREGCEGCRWKP